MSANVEESGRGALSVVVPSYNACGYLERMLATLHRELPDCEVIVVDGASGDGSAAMVRRLYPQYCIIDTHNHGFAHAVNRGIELATGELILLANSDLIVTGRTVRAMAERLATRPWVGAVAPVLVNEDRSRQHVFGTLYWPNWQTIRRPVRAPVLSAACLMVRRDVLDRVGGLDENLFLYNEEHDWCARARAAGYSLELLPETVVHTGGASTRPCPELVLESRRGFLYVAKKHGWPITPLLRWSMFFEGFSKSRLDWRGDYRAMWSRLETIARRGEYLESPFPLSGRGTPRLGAG